MSRGQVIALIGADGTGKSTVASRVRRALGDAARLVYLGSNPTAATHALPTTRLLWAVKRALGRELHHSGPPSLAAARTRPRGAAARAKQHAKSLLVLAARAPEEAYRFAVVAWHRARGRTVLVDRHPLPDHFGRDRRGTRGWLRLGDRLHGWLIARVYPRPDRVVWLDAPTEVLWARKAEGTPEALDARRQEYAEFAATAAGVTRVDAAAPVEDVTQAVLGALAAASSGPSSRVAASLAPHDPASWLRALRTRMLYRSLDAVVAARTRTGLDPGYRRSRTSNFERIGRWTRAAARRTPRVVEALQRYALDTAHSSFAGGALTPFAYGSGSTCFLTSGPRPFVVKVIRESLGRELPALLALGRHVMRDQRTLAGWYAEVPGLLAPTTVMVLHGPLRGAAALARVQALVTAPTTDLLGDHSDDELLALFARHAALARSFLAFADATARAARDEGQALDLVGRENLMLVHHEAGPALHIIDFGLMGLEEQRRARPALHAELMALLARIDALAARHRAAAEARG